MNNSKEEMRKIVEAMEGINEAPIPEDWQIQKAYNVAEQGMHMFMSRVKKLNRMINEFEGSDDLKRQWHYETALLVEQLEDFFKHLD